MTHIHSDRRMNSVIKSSIVIVLIFIGLLPSIVLSEERKEDNKIIGQDICSLPKNYINNQSGVYIKDKQSHSVVYAKVNDKKTIILLKSAPEPSICGMIVSIIDISNFTEKAVPQFKCYYKTKRSQRWGNVIGVGDNNDGLTRFITPIQAWVLDSERDIYIATKPDKVICDTSGYSD